MTSAIGNKLTQEGHSTALYNSSSHVLHTDSLAAVKHATSQEEVHIVGSEPFLLFPGRWTMDGEGGGVGGRERERYAEGKHFYSFFVEDTGIPRKHKVFVDLLCCSCRKYTYAFQGLCVSAVFRKLLISIFFKSSVYNATTVGPQWTSKCLTWFVQKAALGGKRSN